MVRLSLSLAAVAWAVQMVGCTHCDTCDEFPSPCVGQNMGYPVGTTVPMGVPGPAPGMPVVAPMPTVSSVPAATSNRVVSSPPAMGAFTPAAAAAAAAAATTTPNSAASAAPLPRMGDGNSPPPPTSLGDAPKG